MLKTIILLLLGLVYGNAIEVKKNESFYQYDIQINIDSTKKNGKDWDISGGAPDIKISTDGIFLPMNQKCRNKYRCTISFVSNKTSWYFENYDMDISSDDLIGKGDCSVGKPCHLGSSYVSIIRRIK